MYGTSSQKREVTDAQINKWLEQKAIKPLKSPQATPVIIVYWNSKPQFCINYCKQNSVTVWDEFLLPQQAEILQALSGVSLWSLHKFKWLPFGLCNGPSVLQRVMQSILAHFSGSSP